MSAPICACSRDVNLAFSRRAGELPTPSSARPPVSSFSLPFPVAHRCHRFSALCLPAGPVLWSSTCRRGKHYYGFPDMLASSQATAELEGCERGALFFLGSIPPTLQSFLVLVSLVATKDRSRVARCFLTPRPRRPCACGRVPHPTPTLNAMWSWVLSEYPRQTVQVLRPCVFD